MIPSAAKQKGTALTWVVSLFFIFMMVALVVDSGRLYYEKRQLQTAANQLATRLAEEGQTCSGAFSGIDIEGIATPELNAMISGGLVSSKAAVDYAVLALIESSAGPTGSVYSIVEVNNADESNGVSVGLTMPVTGLLAFAVNQPITAEATVRKELVVGARIASEVASLDTTQSALLSLVFGDILGSNLALNGVGLTQLNSALTDVGDLVEAAGLASAVNAIPIDTLLLDVLDASEGVTGPAASVVQGLADSAVGNNVSIDDVIKGVHEAQVPPGSKVPALGLVQSIILNADNALPKNINLNLNDLAGTPALGGLLSTLASLEIDLRITPSPGFLLASAKRDADGNWPEATSTAITANIEVQAGLGPINLASIDLDVETARANVELRMADCVSGQNNLIPSISMVGDADLVGIVADVDLLDIGGLLGVSVDLDSQEQMAGSINADFSNIDMSFYNDTDPKEFRNFDGSDTVLSDLLDALVGSAEVCVKILGIPVCTGPTVGDVLTPLTDILSGLVDSLLSPLLQALGVTLVPSELTLDSVGQTYTLIELGVAD